jgi:hypothetical protein
MLQINKRMTLNQEHFVRKLDSGQSLLYGRHVLNRLATITSGLF